MVVGQNFTELIKYKYRYTFYDVSEDDIKCDFEESKYISPKDFFHTLGQIINSKKGFLKELPIGTVFYRGRRFQDENEAFSAKNLGTPPREKAKYASRMSPPGIALFYGALDSKTALKEIESNSLSLQEDRAVYVIGKFKTLTKLRILNLCDLPPTPSLFDKKHRDFRQIIKFLRKFVSEISLEIKKDGKEHVEYIPTQVMTEYFRNIFKTKKKKRINGIFYKSSRGEGTCCVAFIENKSCVDEGDECNEEAILLLESYSINDQRKHQDSS